jgi:hypothetical protein
MREKLLLIVGAALLWGAASWGQEPPPPPEGDMPHIAIAAFGEPPEGTVMTGDPETDTPVVITTIFGMLDTDGNGELSQEELEAGILHVHIPPMMPGDGMGPDGCGDGCMGAADGCGGDGCMGAADGCGDDGCMGAPDGCGGDGCMGGPDGCGDGGCMGDGISAGMEGTEDLPEPDCSAANMDAEMSPVEENVSCPNSDAVGNLVHRTVCNEDPFRSQAISLPADRAADCFNISAIRGNNIEFEIINEADGTVLFHTSMGEEAYRMLVLTGEVIYRVNLINADEADAGITVEFIDHPMF